MGKKKRERKYIKEKGVNIHQNRGGSPEEGSDTGLLSHPSLQQNSSSVSMSSFGFSRREGKLI